MSHLIAHPCSFIFGPLCFSLPCCLLASFHAFRGPSWGRHRRCRLKTSHCFIFSLITRLLNYIPLIGHAEGCCHGPPLLLLCTRFFRRVERLEKVIYDDCALLLVLMLWLMPFCLLYINQFQLSRPPFPRRDSALSGFFVCGVISFSDYFAYFREHRSSLAARRSSLS
jgi:hypothetical protein